MTDAAVAEIPHAPWKPKANPWLIAVAVTLATFMEVLDTTIVNVALPHIAGSMSASADEATWALTSYLVANGIVLTISGWLGDLLGRKRYFLICIAMFTVCSFLCGSATSLSQLIVFRLAQGFFGGGMQPNQQSIILDTFEPARRGAAFGVAAMATIVAPVLGPTLGGYITDVASWRWIFFLNVPVGIVAVFLVSALVEDPPWVKERRSHGVDYIGLGLIIVGLGCLEIMMDRGEDADWFNSTFIRTMAILSFLGITGAIAWLQVAKRPIVHLDVFKDRNFATSCLMIAATGGLLYASAVTIPQMAQEYLGYTATWAGLILSPGGIMIIFMIPFIGKLLKRTAGAQPDRRRLHHHGLRLPLFEPSGPQYQFRDIGRHAHVPDGGAGLPVRADQHRRLYDAAARTQWRRRGAVRHAAQRGRFDRHFARHGHRDPTRRGPSEFHDAMGNPFPPALRQHDRQY